MMPPKRTFLPSAERAPAVEKDFDVAVRCPAIVHANTLLASFPASHSSDGATGGKRRDLPAMGQAGLFMSARAPASCPRLRRQAGRRHIRRRRGTLRSRVLPQRPAHRRGFSAWVNTSSDRWPRTPIPTTVAAGASTASRLRSQGPATREPLKPGCEVATPRGPTCSRCSPQRSGEKKPPVNSSGGGCSSSRVRNCSTTGAAANGSSPTICYPGARKTDAAVEGASQASRARFALDQSCTNSTSRKWAA
jgi:hypothetical protein